MQGGFGHCAERFVVCRACSTAWGCKSPLQPDGGEGGGKAQGRHREVASEGSVEQPCDLTNSNQV
jgi:hypothetical protein